MVIGQHTGSINIMYNGPAQDMEEQRATTPTEEKTCLINDLADNELRFRDMDLPKVSTEHDQRL